MNQLDQSTQSNAASSEQVEAAAEQLLEQAGNLNAMVTSLNEIIQGKGSLKSLSSTLSKIEKSEKPAEVRWTTRSESKPREPKKATKPQNVNNLVHLSSKISSRKAAAAIPFDDDQDARANVDSNKLQRPSTSSDPKRKIGTTEGF
jgi:uncharacterized phage infection (PIP) family protein YhgE